MKYHGDDEADISELFGDSEETEFTFLLLPVKTYKIIKEIASMEKRSAADVFETALINYVKAAKNNDSSSKYKGIEDQEDEYLEGNREYYSPEFVVRRKR